MGDSISPTAVSFPAVGAFAPSAATVRFWCAPAGGMAEDMLFTGVAHMQRNSSHTNPTRAIIFSRSNPAIKAIRALSSRKQRDSSGRFFVDGLHLVAAATQQQAEIESCVIAPELLTSAFGRELARSLAHSGAPTLEVTADVFRSLAAILRTCDAVGGAGVILLGSTTDPYDPAAVRASMGAIFSQRLARTSFAELTAWCGRHSVAVVGTSPSAPLDYQAVAYQSPLVLLMGSEPRGLSSEQQALCDLTVNIPMVGHSDSLNLAVATGIMLYEVFNQRRETL